ncbi:MAG: phytanoyl-CoA dioxygenase family protein [Isosphaeraceae bacterium]
MDEFETEGEQPSIYYKTLPTYRPDEVGRMAAAMHEDGFVLIPKVLDAATVAEARDRIDRLQPLRWDFQGPTDHYKNVFNRDPFWLSFLDRPGVIDVAEACLGSQCHIIGETAWRSHPGHRGVRLHLDYQAFEWPEGSWPEGVPIPMFLATAHFYLSPQHHRLCPTYVIPGSHRAGRRPARTDTHWQGRIPQAVLCEAGDVLFFRSDLWHSGSDNLMEETCRYLLQVHYGRREMAQHFAPYLDWRFHPGVIAECSPRQRRLLGEHPQGAYD